MSQTRRLAAILAADVAGYSRLMGADEEGRLPKSNGSSGLVTCKKFHAFTLHASRADRYLKATALPNVHRRLLFSRRI
jgi:hypothetical protein